MFNRGTNEQPGANRQGGSDIGIGEDARRDLAVAMSRLLADTFALYLKTHNFHWNVTGPMFRTLHVMFEEQYNKLWLAVDEVAERLRALGALAPASFREYAELTALAEPEGQPEALDMVRQLVADHETVCRTARTAVEMCERAHDAASVDLLGKRLRDHEEMAWMLRSLLET